MFNRLLRVSDTVCTPAIVANWDKKQNCPKGLVIDAPLGYDSCMLLPLWIENNKRKSRELAAHVGWPTSMVSKVKLGRKQVPADKCPAIEEFTERAVTCEEMRPDVKWHVLRGAKLLPGSAIPMNAPPADQAREVVIHPEARCASNDSADVQPGRA